ncbi:MAG: hypothetical protein KatS3mg113_0628 [Planctomycetaceae bacterium]|nr:MAG: hypothetical protein KatS3mg113_0628 [Planctomycetaceae bacterium]
MRWPSRRSTTFLSLFLMLHGGIIVLQLDRAGLSPLFHALSGITAFVAGILLWYEN